VSEANEDILLSGRERAEGFPLCYAVAVTVTPSFPSERAEGFTICGADAGAVAVPDAVEVLAAVTPHAHTPVRRT
jgi:hypothetical protein